MKEKIIAAIKAKYPAVNLSPKRLDAIAAILEPKVTDETLIDAQLDAFNDFNPIAEIAKTDDRIRSLEAKTKTPGQPKTPTDKKDEDAPPTPVDDTPAWAKPLIETVKALVGEKQQSTIKAKLAEKLKDVPESYWVKRLLPEKDEEIDAFIADVTNDFGAFTKEITDKGIGVIPKPGAGGKAADTKEATKEEVAEVVSAIM